MLALFFEGASRIYREEMRSLSFGLFAAWFLCSTLGCSSTSNGSSSSKGADRGSGGSSSGGGSTDGLSCYGVLQCANACPDDSTADACAQDCVDRTAPASQAVTQAFIRCLSDNACQDADCTKQKCGNEANACVADDGAASTGSPSTGTPAPSAGSIPADVVGVWGYANGSWQFEGDGSTTQVFSTQTGNDTCTYGTGLTSSGVTTVDGDRLVYHRAEGTLVSTSCGTSTSEPMDPRDVTYVYSVTTTDGQPELSLSIVNDDGTVGEPTLLHH